MSCNDSSYNKGMMEMCQADGDGLGNDSNYDDGVMEIFQAM